MTATVETTATPLIGTPTPGGIPGAEGISLRASEMLGRSVEDRQSRIVGTVEDVMFDLGSGRITYVILAVEDMPNVDEKWVAIPLNVFRLDTQDPNGESGGTLVLAVEADFLATAPSYDAGRLPDTTNPNWDEEIRSYWEQES